jgi:hypothetical protein
MTFDEYVAGKTIAVVGAAPLPYDQSAEIDGHDIVYRANLHRPGPEYGQKTDVVFLNGWMSRKTYDDDASWWRERCEDATFWVFKGPRGERRDGLYKRAHKVPIVNPNAVTAMLWDLIHYGPASISVYGTDLYSGGPEAAYYPGYKRRPLAEQASSFLLHKPMEQMRIHRQVVATGKVVGDDRYLKAVAQTDEEYQAVIDRWRAVTEEAA